MVVIIVEMTSNKSKTITPIMRRKIRRNLIKIMREVRLPICKRRNALFYPHDEKARHSVTAYVGLFCGQTGKYQVLRFFNQLDVGDQFYILADHQTARICQLHVIKAKFLTANPAFHFKANPQLSI